MRVERDGAAEDLHALLPPPGANQRQPVIPGDPGVVRRQLDGDAILLQRIADPSDLDKRRRRLGAHQPVARVELDRGLVAAQRLGKPLQCRQRLRQVKMELREPRDDLDGALEQRQRPRRLPMLRRQHAEQVQGVGIVRLIRQNAPIPRLRLRRAPGLVIVQGALKNLRRLLRGHDFHVIA